MTAPKYEDVRIEASKYSNISLCKLTGKKIADIHGYLSNEFGSPTFKVSVIVFEDGANAFVEGEHDFPYLADVPGVSDDDMARLMGEQAALDE